MSCWGTGLTAQQLDGVIASLYCLVDVPKMTISSSANSCVTLTYCTAALLLLVLLNTCDAQHTSNVAMRGKVERAPAFLAGQRNFHSNPSDLSPGVTYRPPIINFNYQGGSVMWKPIHLYFVWYGTWTEAEKNVIRTATNSLTPNKPIPQWPNLSNLWELATKYYQEVPGDIQGRKYTTNSVTITKEIYDDYSFGHTINAIGDPLSIISSHLGQGDLPFDFEQGIYFLFTAGDVRFQASNFCGYHDFNCHNFSRGIPYCFDFHNNLIYSFVPLPSEYNGLLQGCGNFRNPSTPDPVLPYPPPNKAVSPNGALDSMVVVYLHELLETAVDPYITAWIHNYTENSEASDLCSYNFAAGDWYYCDLPSIYPDFPGVNDSRCLSYPKLHTLREPKSKAAFNIYGIDGSQFLAQKFWDLANKGCASQPEEPCATTTMVLHEHKGTIQRGYFFGGVGVQTYAPGQNCNWKILVPGAKSITAYFENVALGYDDLDYVTVGHESMVKKKVTGFCKGVEVEVSGNEANVHFTTYGGRSPYPDSAGFIMHYTAGY